MLSKIQKEVFTVLRSTKYIYEVYTHAIISDFMKQKL